MGHYASEMNGPPYDWYATISNEIGELFLKHNKLKFTSITETKIKWILPYNYYKRTYIEVTYKNDKGIWKDTNMTSGGLSFDGFPLCENHINMLENDLSKSKYITNDDIKHILGKIKLKNKKNYV